MIIPGDVDYFLQMMERPSDAGLWSHGSCRNHASAVHGHGTLVHKARAGGGREGERV
jgi:hypothetical protein